MFFERRWIENSFLGSYPPPLMLSSAIIWADLLCFYILLRFAIFGQLLLIWSRPIKTYQKWLREEIFLSEDCLDDKLCSDDLENDDVNMATSIVLTPTAINIADFARYYNILRHMERLQHVCSYALVIFRSRERHQFLLHNSFYLLLTKVAEISQILYF
jgi:hypothetical protein